MATGDWAAAELCLDADLTEFETDAVNSWTGSIGSAGKWRTKAKEMIGERLDHALRAIELATDEADVKDLIDNLERLKDPACYLTLHLLANDNSQGQADLYDRKAEMYFAKYEAELPRAISLLSIDIDESGDITDSEKYAGPSGAQLRHGG